MTQSKDGTAWRDISTFEYRPGDVPPKVRIFDPRNGVETAQYVPPRSSRSPAWWATVPGRWQRQPTHWASLEPPPVEGEDGAAEQSDLAREGQKPTGSEGLVERLEKKAVALKTFSDACSDARYWGGPTVYPKNPVGEYEASRLSALLTDAAEALITAEHQLKGYKHHLDQCEQIAGKALGYPWFKDDQKNFPGATEADGVCIGEHVADTIVEELAARLIIAEADRDGWRRIAEDEREALEGTQGQLRDANAAVLAAEAERDEAILIAELNRRDKIEWKSRALAAEARLSAIEGGGNEGADSTNIAAAGPSDCAASEASWKSESSLRGALYGALVGYRLTNMGDEDGNGYPLVDLCSNDGSSIETGREELFALADYVAADHGVKAAFGAAEDAQRKSEDDLPRVYHYGAALRGIADEHADVLTPRQRKALYEAGDLLQDPFAERVAFLEEALTSWRVNAERCVLDHATGGRITLWQGQSMVHLAGVHGSLTRTAALSSEAPSPQSEAKPSAGNSATDQSNTSPTSQSEGEAS